MGYAAARGVLELQAFVLYAAAVLWILGYDTIYAHQDREDDALVGIRSTARLFAERSQAFLSVCYAGTVLLIGVAGWMAGLGPFFFVGLAVAALGLVWQIRRLDIHDPGLCLRLFHSNREFGLLVGVVILLGRI